MSKRHYSITSPNIFILIFIDVQIKFITTTLFKYLKAVMFISKYFINDDLDVLDRNRCNICFKATDGAGGIIAKISFKDKLLWTHGKFSTSELHSDRSFELVFTKEILDSIQIGRV